MDDSKSMAMETINTIYSRFCPTCNREGITFRDRYLEEWDGEPMGVAFFDEYHCPHCGATWTVKYGAIDAYKNSAPDGGWA